MATEKLYDAWAKRNPQWEIRYEENIVKTFCEYGKGATSLRDARGKIFGAGYEIMIIAFFIGLYFDERRPLNPDKSKLKSLGQAIQFWGNIDSVKGRRPYPKIREYIFAALIAKTDIDLIALEKGDITLRQAVDRLMDTMEEYINWGLHFMEDKLIDNPNYFYTPITITFTSPNKRSFLLLVNKLSMTSNTNNIALLNEFFHHLLESIKAKKAEEIRELEEEYRDMFIKSDS